MSCQKSLQSMLHALRVVVNTIQKCGSPKASEILWYVWLPMSMLLQASLSSEIEFMWRPMTELMSRSFKSGLGLQGKWREKTTYGAHAWWQTPCSEKLKLCALPQGPPVHHGQQPYLPKVYFPYATNRHLTFFGKHLYSILRLYLLCTDLSQWPQLVTCLTVNQWDFSILLIGS